MSGYYGDPFQGSRGVTQGKPISHRIFNIVVGAIFCHWVGMTAENEDGPEGFRYMVSEKVDLFYANEGLVASTNPVWIKWGFGVLISLIVRVGLQTNFSKTVSVVYQPGHIDGQQYAEAYGRRMDGEEGTHRVSQLRRVVCE